jgi:hypothetical protein
VEVYKNKKRMHAKVRSLLNLSKEEQPRISVFDRVSKEWVGPAKIDPKFSSSGDSASGFTICVTKVGESKSRTFYSDEIGELRVYASRRACRDHRAK